MVEAKIINKNMEFILYLMGGLGNQLFQYANMRYLQTLHPDSIMYIDKRGYRNYKVRNFELESFNLIDNTRIYEKLPIKYLLSRKLFHLYQFIYQKAKHKQAPMLGRIFQSKGFIYGTIEFNTPSKISSKTNFLYGYFATFEHIDSIRNILIEEISLKESLRDNAQHFYEKIYKEEHPVGVSIRYGKDYQTLGWPICQPAYYKSAMKKIEEKRGKCKFFVFCDVIDVVKQEGWFGDYDVEYICGVSVPESFTLLKSCSDFVIPNSSFSVWAAYLSENPDKIVYAPNYFYIENYNHRYDRLLHFTGEKFLDYRTGEETVDV